MDNKLQFHVSDVEHFVNGQVWKVVVEDAMEKALLASVDLEHLDPLTSATQIARNQGLIEALKWIVDLPRIYVDEIESYSVTKSEEKES